MSISLAALLGIFYPLSASTQQTFVRDGILSQTPARAREAVHAALGEPGKLSLTVLRALADINVLNVAVELTGKPDKIREVKMPIPGAGAKVAVSTTFNPWFWDELESGE